MLLAHSYLPLTLVRKQVDPVVPYMYADSDKYIAIAKGRIAEVASPYSRRVLYPLLAANFARIFHMPIGASFAEINLLAFIFMAYCLAALLQQLGVKAWYVVLVLLTPLPLESLQRAYLPDLFHMALSSLFFYLVACGRDKLAVITLMLCFLARENTILICLIVGFVAWRYNRKLLALGAVMVLLVGLACDARFVHLGEPNRHHLPEFIYMAFFVPCSFLGNVLGVVIWTNSTPDEGGPWLLHWQIPHALQFGADHDVYIAYEWMRAFQTGISLTTLFGCGPVFLWYLWKKFPFKLHWNIILQITFVYGLLAFLSGTSLGRTGTSRLIGYAWPLFWIALPCLVLQAKIKLRVVEAWFLIILSLIITWVPNFAGFWGQELRARIGLMAIPLLYIATIYCLNRIARAANISTNPKLEFEPEVKAC